MNREAPPGNQNLTEKRQQFGGVAGDTEDLLPEMLEPFADVEVAVAAARMGLLGRDRLFDVLQQRGEARRHVFERGIERPRRPEQQERADGVERVDSAEIEADGTGRRFMNIRQRPIQRFGARDLPMAMRRQHGTGAAIASFEEGPPVGHGASLAIRAITTTCSG